MSRSRKENALKYKFFLVSKVLSEKKTKSCNVLDKTFNMFLYIYYLICSKLLVNTSAKFQKYLLKMQRIAKFCPSILVFYYFKGFHGRLLQLYLKVSLFFLMNRSEVLQNIARQELTRAVYSFLSTPHRGVTRRQYPELKSSSSYLTKLCSRFAIEPMIKYSN